MGRKAKYSKEVKLEIERRYISGESASKLAIEFMIEGKHPVSRISKWRSKYEAVGDGAFDPSHKNNYHKYEI